MTLRTLEHLAYLAFLVFLFYYARKAHKWLNRNGDNRHWNRHITDNENSPFLHHPSHNGLIAKFRAQHKRRVEEQGIDYDYGFDSKGKPTRKFDNTAYKEQFKHLPKEKK